MLRELLLGGAAVAGLGDGVVSVLARLLELVVPRLLWLGEQAWQQLVVLRW